METIIGREMANNDMVERCTRGETTYVMEIGNVIKKTVKDMRQEWRKYQIQ